MRIISWNINSLRVRLPLIQDLMEQEKPDVLLLQETKVSDPHFPRGFFEGLGYHVAFWGQKTYNGVAIASRHPLTSVVRGEFSQEARYLEAMTGDLRVVSLYVINGQAVGSPAYEEKLRFLDQVRHHVSPYLEELRGTVIGGDFNVAPYDQDVHDPKAWKNSILCSSQEREALRAWLYQGWQDSLVPQVAFKNPFTWWPYQGRAWEQDRGIRIDFLLTSPWGADLGRDAGTLSSWRGHQRPSDHAPIWMDLQE